MSSSTYCSSAPATAIARHARCPVIAYGYLGCFLLAVGGCGKSQPAAKEVAVAPGEQVVTGKVIYQQTGPATFGSASGIPGPVGAAMPPASQSPPAATAAVAAPAAASPASGSFTAPANPGRMPAGPTQAALPAATVPAPAPATGTSNPPATATASVPPDTPVSSAAASNNRANAVANGSAGVVTSGNVAALAAAINQWRAQGTNRVGVKRLDDKPVLAGYSWMTHLLPYVGHQDLYKKFDFAKGWHEKENLILTFEEIPAFLDPMNKNRHMKIVGEKVELGPAFTHFVGMAGVEDSRNLVAAELPRSDKRAGIFGYNEIARPEQITDGTSTTVMLVSAGKIVGPWVSGGGATVRAARAPYFDDITGFSSAGDPGAGAIVAMADGSVKRISKDIDPAVFRALCTIHGAESIDLSAHSNSIRPQ